MSEDFTKKPIKEAKVSVGNDTAIKTSKTLPKMDYDKKTRYTLNERGEVIEKRETLRDKGLIHFGTGSKGEIKAKNIDIQNTNLDELEKIVNRVAYLQTLMSKLKEEYSKMSIEELREMKHYIEDSRTEDSEDESE